MEPTPKADPKPRWGARALRAFIDRNFGGSASKFCAAHGFSRPFVTRILAGIRGQRVSLDFAVKCQKATGGEVTPEMWLRYGAPRPRRGGVETEAA